MEEWAVPRPVLDLSLAVSSLRNLGNATALLHVTGIRINCGRRAQMKTQPQCPLRTHNRCIALHGQQRLSLPPVWGLRAPDQAARRYRYGTAAGHRCACTGVPAPVCLHRQLPGQQRTGTTRWRINNDGALVIVTFFHCFEQQPLMLTPVKTLRRSASVAAPRCSSACSSTRVWM